MFKSFTRKLGSTVAAASLAVGMSMATVHSAQAMGDIVDTAASAGSFKTLLAAASAAGLVETLKSAGPFTVFAPSDAAFAKLPAGTVESLLKPENKDKLVAILTYHVVPGKVMAADIAGNSLSVKTVQGQSIHVQAFGPVFINHQPMVNRGAKVATADVVASNGVIHVIDRVILPK